MPKSSNWQFIKYVQESLEQRPHFDMTSIESEEISVPSVLPIACLSLSSGFPDSPSFLEPKTWQHWFESRPLPVPVAPASPVWRDSSLCLACFRIPEGERRSRSEVKGTLPGMPQFYNRHRKGKASFGAGHVTSSSVRYCLVTPEFSSSITEEVASLGGE